MCLNSSQHVTTEENSPFLNLDSPGYQLFGAQPHKVTAKTTLTPILKSLELNPCQSHCSYEYYVSYCLPFMFVS